MKKTLISTANIVSKNVKANVALSKEQSGVNAGNLEYKIVSKVLNDSGTFYGLSTGSYVKLICVDTNTPPTGYFECYFAL
jgi:hypothetical protein